MDSLVQNLAKLAAAFPRDNASEATLAVYIDQLAGLDYDVLGQVIDNAISQGTKFPSVAELRQDYRQALSRQPAPEALPMGRTPIPEYVKKQVATLNGAMDERAKDLEPE